MTDEDRAEIAALVLEGRLQKAVHPGYDEPCYVLRLTSDQQQNFGVGYIWCYSVVHALHALRYGPDAWQLIARCWSIKCHEPGCTCPWAVESWPRG